MKDQNTDKTKLDLDEPTSAEYRAAYSVALRAFRAKPWDRLQPFQIVGIDSKDERAKYVMPIGGNGGDIDSLVIFEELIGAFCFSSVVAGDELAMQDFVTGVRRWQISFHSNEINGAEFELNYDFADMFKRAFPKKRQPHFASFRPGYAPSPVSKGELVMITKCLDRYLEYLKHTRSKTINLVECTLAPVSMFMETDDGWGTIDEIVNPGFDSYGDFYGQSKVARIAKTLPVEEGLNVEIGAFPLMMGNGYGKRLTIGRCLIVVDKHTSEDLIVKFISTTPGEEFNFAELTTTIIRYFIERGRAPAQISAWGIQLKYFFSDNVKQVFPNTSFMSNDECITAQQHFYRQVSKG